MGAPLSAPYSLPKLLEWLRTDGPWRSAPTPDDPLLVGSNASPALERYREERAALAKLDREEREGTVLSRAKVHEALAKSAALLRQAGELLHKHHGADAARILEEALDDCQREHDALWMDPTGQA